MVNGVPHTASIVHFSAVIARVGFMLRHLIIWVLTDLPQSDPDIETQRDDGGRQKRRVPALLKEALQLCHNAVSSPQAGPRFIRWQQAQRSAEPYPGFVPETFARVLWRSNSEGLPPCLLRRKEQALTAWTLGLIMPCVCRATPGVQEPAKRFFSCMVPIADCVAHRLEWERSPKNWVDS